MKQSLAISPGRVTFGDLAVDLTPPLDPAEFEQERLLLLVAANPSPALPRDFRELAEKTVTAGWLRGVGQRMRQRINGWKRGSSRWSGRSRWMRQRRCAGNWPRWTAHPNVALAIDRRFTSPAQVAVLNTFLYRHWPTQGVLSISHVDSQRNPLVQLADFVAGSVYAWHKDNDDTLKMIEGKISIALMDEWAAIKQRWT